MTAPKLGRQANAILAAMLAGETVDPMMAMRLCGSWRLAARVRELRENGWNILRELVTENGRVHAVYGIPLNAQRIEDNQCRLFGGAQA